MADIDNSEDIIDSRDIIARIEELSDRDDDEDKSDPLDDDEREELETLRRVADQCERYGDWKRGEALIRDSHFAEYAEQLFVDTHDSKVDMSNWPFNCIDWEKAAEELQQDYMSIDFDGVTYWMRA